MRIIIASGKVSAEAALHNTRTAQQIYDALPLEARASTWGDEIYFAIPVTCQPEDAREVVEVGDLGYWPPGSAFCIFFGRTPASEGDEPRAASAVNVFGKVSGDATVFKQVRSGAIVRLTRAE